MTHFLTRGPRLGLAALAGLLALGGCNYGDGYGGMSVGTGYYSGGYYGDGYYGPAGYGGWYDNYYYPGSGYYVFDRGGHRHRWNDRQRGYWEGRRNHRNDRQAGGRWQGREGDGRNWDRNREGRWDGSRQRRDGAAVAPRVERPARVQRAEPRASAGGRVIERIRRSRQP